jgi:competence protein ComEC
MSKYVRVSPVFYSACGAGFSFYCLFTLYSREIIGFYSLLALVFIPVAVLFLFVVFVFFPIPSSEQTERKLRITLLRIIAFTVGLALGIGAGAKSAQKTAFGIPETQVQAVSGTLLNDPRLISGGRAMATLSLGMSLGSNGVRASAQGEITVFFPEESIGRLREFGRGCEVFAEGSLRRGTGGFVGVYLFPAETLRITQVPPPIERLRTGLRLGLTQRFTRSSTDDASWGGLSLALLLGIRDNLDSGLASLFRGSGCAHIIALSGMHLAVLVGIVSFLLRKVLGFRIAALSGALFIIAYCFIVGPLPSLNRAALMYLLGVLAVIGMLQKEPLSLLGMAFLLQLVMSPRAGYSVSFILSYLALLGIIILGRGLIHIFKGSIPTFLLSPISVSMGAFIATAGVAVSYFGTLYPIGIITGLFLTPLITFYMLGSLAWLGFDQLLPTYSALLSRPLSFIYWLMEKIAAIAGYVPGIRAQPWLVIVLSLLLAVLIIWFDYRRRITANRVEPLA